MTILITDDQVFIKCQLLLIEISTSLFIQIIQYAYWYLIILYINLNYKQYHCDYDNHTDSHNNNN